MKVNSVDQISLLWPVLMQHSRLVLLVASVAVSLAIYSARRRVQRVVPLLVQPLSAAVRG